MKYVFYAIFLQLAFLEFLFFMEANKFNITNWLVTSKIQNIRLIMLKRLKPSATL